MKRLIAAIALLGFCGCAHAAILKSEPAEGTLKAGQGVLIDDGTCPQGQIKEVIGGNNRNGATGSARQIRCIRR